jgi:hypothetical protein
MHHVVFPVPFIDSIVALSVDSPSLDFALEPVAFILWAVDPVIGTFAVFEAVFKVAFIDIAFSGHLGAVATGFIIFPVARVGISVSFYKFALTVCPRVGPLTFIKISRRVCKLSSAVGFVVNPVSWVNSFVWPGLRTESIAHAVADFTVIGDSWVKFKNVDVVLDMDDRAGWQFLDFLLHFSGEIFVRDGTGCLLIELELSILVVLIVGTCIEFPPFFGGVLT